MQAKLQHMISLHHVQQDQMDSEEQSGTDQRSTIAGLGGGLSKRTSTEAVDLSTLGNLPDSSGEAETKLSIRGVSPIDANPWLSDATDGLPPPSPSSQAGVGRGTLHFPSTYDPRKRKNSSDSGVMAMMTMSTQEQKRIHGQQHRDHPLPPHQVYANYGAVSKAEAETLSLPTLDAPAQHQSEADYEYYDPADSDVGDGRKRPEDTFCGKICCLYAPFIRLVSDESVQRSFCFGSIDGILTGSGIASAFCALEVLSLRAKWEVRLAVVVFTAATCLADAICMAIGHVWTSYVVSSGHAQERAIERQQLDVNGADAKAKLMEMLLARGVLKIDAMSLVDTLEGYPDLFVSALVGDSLLAGGDTFQMEDNSDPHLVSLDGAGSTSGGYYSGFNSWRLPSYGHINAMEQEPDNGTLRLVLKESKTEGFFMMLGFATFALVPSLLWLLLPALISTDAAVESSTARGDTISPASIVVSVSALIVWVLGVWKSRFMDSQWIMSGIENVSVLLACVVSAYGVGWFLSHLLASDDGLLLTNATD